MAIDGPSVADVGAFMGELAGLYAVGAVAEAANIQGGRKLRGQVVDLLAEFSERTGLEIGSSSGAAESGIAVAAATTVARVFNWLRATGTSLLSGAAANPGFTLALVGGVGSLSVIDNWLTMDERIQANQARQLGSTMQTAINGMTPEDRARYVANAAGRLSPGWDVGRVVLYGLGAVGIYMGWRWFSER